MEHLAQSGAIDLFYGDETGVSQSGYVPYAWQFLDETVSIPVVRGKTLNCFGLVSRDNRGYFATTKQTITSGYILAQLDQFSLTLTKPTVVVLDQARVHMAKKIKARFSIWQRRGLYVFYLPTYSPHLNIAEIVWRFLKYVWLKPADYERLDTLFYVVTQLLAGFGRDPKIAFNPFAYVQN